jgi:hypothetical protein
MCTGFLACSLMIAASGAVRNRAEAAEADWFYEAAQLMARFDSIVQQLTPSAPDMASCVDLRSALTKFGAAEGVPPREARGRKAFSLWMKQRLSVELRDDAAASVEAASLADELRKAPEQEQALFKVLFEGVATSPRRRQRECNIRVQDTRLSVSAVDWPVNDLLERIAKVAGTRIVVPPGIVGLTDYNSEGWRGVRANLELAALADGLSVVGELGQTLYVTVKDARYNKCVAEVANEQPPRATPIPAAAGIDKGYFFHRGQYIAPPYGVSCHKAKGTTRVQINGLFVQEFPDSPPVSQPTSPPSGRCKDAEELTAFIRREYTIVFHGAGVEAAKKAVTATLTRHGDLVRRFEFEVDTAVTVRFVGNAYDMEVYLYSPSVARGTNKNPDVPSGAEQADALRGQIVAALSEDGVVLVTQSDYAILTGRQGARALHNVVMAMAEADRHRRSIGACFYPSWDSRAHDVSWEIFLNCRYRDLWQRYASRAEGNARQLR